jgi:hypothetical protein
MDERSYALGAAACLRAQERVSEVAGRHGGICRTRVARPGLLSGTAYSSGAGNLPPPGAILLFFDPLDVDEALSCFEQSLEICRALGDRYREG